MLDTLAKSAYTPRFLGRKTAKLASLLFIRHVSCVFTMEIGEFVCVCECTPLCVLTKFGIFINLSCHPVCLCHYLRQGSGKSLRQCLCHCLSTSVPVIVTITASVPLVSFRQCFPDAPTRPFFPKCLLECKCDLCCGLLLGTVTISAVTRLCLASCTEYSGILHLGMLHSSCTWACSLCVQSSGTSDSEVQRH